MVLTGGGTGGHVYPALAVAAALRRRQPLAELTYIGGQGGLEQAIVGRTPLPFCEVAAAPLRGRDPREIGGGLWRLARGLRQAHQLLQRLAPEVVLATGGYVCVPVALAARRLGCPLVVYLPDVRPGWAIRALARMARSIAVTAEESRHYLPVNKVEVTGYPVRPALFETDRAAARAQYGLAPAERLLLVLGGSRGARSINQAVWASLERLLPAARVLHVCGEVEYPALSQQAEGLPAALHPRYRLAGYLHDELPTAMAAADLIVCRSGASTMGELPAVGLPAVLVPYPHAGAHQEANADALVAAGAAVKLLDHQLDELAHVVPDLLAAPARLAAMAAAARTLARPRAAEAIIELLEEARASRKGARP